MQINLIFVLTQLIQYWMFVYFESYVWNSIQYILLLQKYTPRPIVALATKIDQARRWLNI